MAKDKKAIKSIELIGSANLVRTSKSIVIVGF